MKKLFKITSIAFLSVLLVLTLIIHLLPFFINVDDYKSLAINEFNRATGMVLDVGNMELSVLPMFNARIVLNDVDIDDKSKKEILDAKKVEVSVSLLPLLSKSLKLNYIKIDAPNAFLSRKMFMPPEVAKKPKKDNIRLHSASPISIDIDSLNLMVNDYNVEYFDGSAPVNLKVKVAGQNANIKNFNPEGKMDVSTKGVVSLNSKPNISYDINAKVNLAMIYTSKDALPSKAVSPEKSKKINGKDFNILYELFKNNIKMNIKADVDVNDFDDIDGEVLLDEFSLKVNNEQLPNSKIYLKAKGGKFSTNSKIHIRKGASILVKGDFKDDLMALKVKSSLIELSDVKALGKVILSSLGLPLRELDKLRMTGNLIANLDLESDFRTLTSSGYLKLNNANIAYRGVKPSISAFNADVKMKDNNVVISNTGGFFAGDRFDITGKIDSKTNTDLVVSMPSLRLRPLFDEYKKQSNLDAVKNINLKGLAGMRIVLKGNFNEVIPTVRVILNDVYLSSSDFSLPLNIRKGKILADSSKLSLDIPCALLNKSKFDISGSIPYSLKKFNIIALGDLQSDDFAKLVGAESLGKGVVPAFFNVWGNLKNTHLNAQILNTKDDYVLIGDIGDNNLLNSHFVLSGGKMTFEDVSLKRTTNKNLRADWGLNISGSKNIANVEGAIVDLGEDAKFDNVKVIIKNPVDFILPIGKNSTASIEGKIYVKGALKAPMLNGDFVVSDVKIPDMKAKINYIGLKVDKDNVNFVIPSILVGKSAINIQGNVDMNDFDPVIISGLDISSDYFDADEFLGLISNLGSSDVPQASPPKAHASYSLKKHYVPNVSPVVIKNGKFNADKFIINKVACSNLTANLLYDRYSLFTADNLSTSALGGDIVGSVSYDVPSSKTSLNIDAKDVEVNDFVVKFLNLPPDQIVGKGYAKVNLAFKGASTEQLLHSMQGNVEFDVKDGEMGDLGRIDHYLSAANIISNNILSLNLNRIINGVSMKKTGEFKKAYGRLVFIPGGVMRIDHLKTEGPKLSIYIRGDVNNLNSYGSLDVYGRLSQDIVKVLGPLGEFSLETVMKKVPILSELSKYGIGILETSVPTNLKEEIPALSEPSLNAQEFKAKIKGNIYKASSVKSFRWIREPDSTQTKQSQPQSLPLGRDAEKILKETQQIFSIFQDQKSH